MPATTVAADEYLGQGQGRRAEEKNIYERSHQLIENKGSQNNLTEKKRTFWSNFRTFWSSVMTFWRDLAAFPRAFWFNVLTFCRGRPWRPGAFARTCFRTSEGSFTASKPWVNDRTIKFQKARAAGGIV